MSPEEIYRLGKDAFAQATELDPAKLEAFLGQLHPLVRTEVEELLFYEKKANEIFGVGKPTLTSEAPVSLALEGRQLAKYILRKVIGSGGAATVYLANRADALFEKLVAIKVLHQRISSEETFQRFQRELQVLARLEHPCIVRFSEADITEDRLAYIVMEYIDGVPIDHYCSAVSIDERVRLVLRVAEAFCVAHEQKVIHRDIKPQNILVNKNGVPKILDFGVALLLDAPVRLTVPGEGRITIPYASPEQILGRPIGPTTDIYSLGVVFYELLCGRLPFVGEPPLQLMQAILKDDPPSPRALNPDIARPLEGICLKMLEKNPTDRYQAMAEAVTDLQLFLDGSRIPVQRRRYFGVPRYFRKHAKVTAGVLAFTLLASLLAFLYVQKKRADENLRQGIEFFQMTVLQVTQARTQTSLFSLQALQKAEGILEGLLQQYPGNQELERQLRELLENYGMTLGHPGVQSVGQSDLALEVLHKAEAVASRLHQRFPENEDDSIHYASVQCHIGTVLLEQNRLREAREHFQLALPIKSETENGTPFAKRRSAAHAQALAGLSDVACDEGRIEECLRLRREALRIRRGIADGQPSSLGFQFGLSLGLAQYGWVLREAGNFEEALIAYEQALTELAAYPIETRVKDVPLLSMEARNRYEIGRILLALGKPGPAKENLQTSSEMLRRIRIMEPESVSNLRYLALTLSSLATLEAQPANRRALAREAFAIADRVQGRDPNNAKAKSDCELVKERVRRLLD